MGPGFGLSERGKTLEKYIGKYVIIYSISGGSTESGRMVRIEEYGWVVLNPFQGGHYDAKEGLERRMIEEDSLVNINNIHAVEPVSEEDLRAYCEWSNKRSKLENEIGSKSHKSR